jgi:hypothetical protein
MEKEMHTMYTVYYVMLYFLTQLLGTLLMLKQLVEPGGVRKKKKSSEKRSVSHLADGCFIFPSAFRNATYIWWSHTAVIKGTWSWPLVFEEVHNMRIGRDDFPQAVTSVNWFPNDGCIEMMLPVIPKGQSSEDLSAAGSRQILRPQSAFSL